MSEHHMPTLAADVPAHEPIALSGRRILVWGLGLATLIALALSLMWVLWKRLEATRATAASLEAAESPEQGAAEPNLTPLDPHQQASRRKYERRQEQLLKSYGWVDRKQGVARIPVERAMQIVLERSEATP